MGVIFDLTEWISSFLDGHTSTTTATTTTRSENNHCSSCQTHNKSSDCGAQIQTFKNIYGRKVSQNETDIKLNSLYPSVTQNVTKIQNETWDKLREILGYVTEYGELGTRNPTTQQVNTVTATEHEKIYLNDYNKILTVLDESNKKLSGNPIITKQLIDDLNNYIKNYQLNTNRCNICNTQCQGCQSGNNGGCDDPAQDCYYQYNEYIAHYHGGGGDCQYSYDK